MGSVVDLEELQSLVAALEVARGTKEPNSSKLTIEVKRDGVAFTLRRDQLFDQYSGTGWIDAAGAEEAAHALIAASMPTEPWPKPVVWPSGSVPVTGKSRDLSPGTRIGFARRDGTVAVATLRRRHTIDKELVHDGAIDMRAWRVDKVDGLVADVIADESLERERDDVRVLPALAAGDPPDPDGDLLGWSMPAAVKEV